MRRPMHRHLLTTLVVAGLLAACGNESPEKLIASGEGYLAKSETNAAIIQFKRALDEAPDSPQARRWLGHALLLSGDPVGAEAELRKAQQRGAPDDAVLPDLARAMLLLGQASKITAEFSNAALNDPAARADLKTLLAAAYAQQGDLARSDMEIASALQAVPLYPPAVMVQARLKASTGDIDGALAMLDAILAKDPSNDLAGVAKGYLLWFGKRDADAALEAHRRVLATKPDSVAAQAEIVTLLFGQSRTAESRQEFDLLRRMAPRHPQTLFFEAQFAYVDRQYRRARELADVLLNAAPDHYRALELAAAAEYQLGNDVQAQALLGRALKVAPGLVLSRQILAQSYLRTGQPAKALDAVSPLIAGERADAESLALAGTAHMQLGEVSRADAAFKRARELAPASARIRTSAALADLAGGRADIAVRELQAIAAGDESARADLSLISALIAQGDLRGAMKAVDSLLAKQPEQALPHQLRGQLLVAMRDAEGARRSFEAALAKDGKYFPAVAALASMDMAQGKPDAARTRASEFLKVIPNHPRAMMLLADIAGASGAPPSEALKHLNDAVRADPTDVQAHLALIGRHVQYADRSGALASAQSAAAALPNDPRIQESLGQAQLLAGEAQQSISTFRKLTALQPTDARLQMRLAEAFAAGGDYESAQRALRRAAELDPALAEAHHALAMLALRENRFEQALAISRDMQKRQPKGALGYAAEGEVEIRRKNWPKAAEAYRSALVYSQASEAAIKLHAILRAAGKAAEADRLAAEWEKARPKDPAFHFYLGDLATNQNNYAQAEAHYRTVLIAQPDNGMAMNNVAWLLHKQAKPGALEMAEKANIALPNRAPVLDTLAAILAEQGQMQAAIAMQQRAVAASPQDPNLKLALARHLIKAQRRDEARVQLDALAKLGDTFAGHAEVTALRRGL